MSYYTSALAVIFFHQPKTTGAKRVGKMTKRFEAKSKKNNKNLPKPTNVFTITGKSLHKTAEAIYHNAKNIVLKLASFGFVSKKLKITGFPKRIEANKAEGNNSLKLEKKDCFC
jgi:hypothetical protein